MLFFIILNDIEFKILLLTFSKKPKINGPILTVNHIPGSYFYDGLVKSFSLFKNVFLNFTGFFLFFSMIYSIRTIHILLVLLPGKLFIIFLCSSGKQTLTKIFSLFKLKTLKNSQRFKRYYRRSSSGLT